MAKRGLRRVRHNADEEIVRADGASTDEAPRPRLSDLMADKTYATERSVRYNDWADRLRDKRQRSRDEAVAATAPKVTYWNPDALFAESRRLDEEAIIDRADSSQVNDLLAVLDLRDNAGADDVSAAYRRLAKQHHPDHFSDADEATRAWHETRMQAINTAYRALRQLPRD